MDQSRTLKKLLRALRFRKYVKDLTTTSCKRVNKDACFDFITANSVEPPVEKESKKTHRWRSKLRHAQSNRFETIYCSPTVNRFRPTFEQVTDYEHLCRATSFSPANIPMIVSQSYKPLHVKSTQLNKNLIAVSKGTKIKALYKNLNWVFIEIIETGQTGFIPFYCLDFSRKSSSPMESISQNNLSLLNVSIHEKIQHRRRSTSGEFVTSIGPCSMKTVEQQHQQLFTRVQTRTDQSVLSEEISNVSLEDGNADIYGTLNLTPSKSYSLSVLDVPRLRAIETYQRQFVGDISVLQSELLTLVDSDDSMSDWRLVRRGDGKQGYVPKQILIYE